MSDSSQQYLTHLVGILDAMSALPYAADIVVFGSMAKNADNPGDVDIAVRCDDQLYNDLHYPTRPYRDLINLARTHYGLLDPFLLFKNILVVRNDTATGWQRAHNTRSIRKEIVDNGRPLDDVLAVYKARLTPRQVNKFAHDDGLAL